MILSTGFLLSVALTLGILSAPVPVLEQDAPLTARSEAPGDHPVSVTVRQVSNGRVFLDLGSLHGLEPGDTISVSRGSLSRILGRLVVLGTNEERSVLAPLPGGLQLKSGDEVILHLLRPGRVPVAAPEAGARVGGSPAAEDTAPQTSARSGGQVQLHGSAALELSAMRSVTTVGDPAVEKERSFATPTLRVDAWADDLGGFRLRTSFRLAYRYAEPRLGSPALAPRVHHAALERSFTTVPVRLMLGRFHSPVDAYSGVWDGVFLRLGRQQLGVGAILGLQPDRWNEAPSMEHPKATLFVDADRGGQGWRWRASLSGHALDPGTGLSPSFFLGLDQTVSIGRLHLAQEIRLDRAPSNGAWGLGYLALRGSVPLVPSTDLRLGASRRESDPWTLAWSLSPYPRRDRLNGGLSVRMARASLGLDISLNRDGDGSQSTAYTGSFVAPLGGRGRGPVLGGSASWWQGDRGRTVSASPFLSFRVAPLRLRFGYRFYRFSNDESKTMIRGADVSLDTPLGRGTALSMGVRKAWGGALSNGVLRLSLSRNF